ncbi:M23 family metallopeptidase [Luteimonas sp. TWI662]|uniref:M23 family metallopeptidase n=1 Tax=Luteimonas sp. TWI662 TaxID=3136789 RepID=UPI003209015A
MPPVVRLQRQPVGRRVGIVAENTLAGPVEVLLTADGATPGSDPPLPARATVPAYGRTLVAWLPDAADSAVTLALTAVPGHPGARPRDVEYGYPLRGAPLRVAQGFGGGFSHRAPEHAYAVDFAVDAGTPVLAARDGTVMQTEVAIGGNTRIGTAHDDPARANFVRVLHDDGTMALYAHLQRGGVIVAPGERVRRGQILGFSGDTGASTGPHLHFAVQANRGLRLESLPFRMFGPGGILRFSAPPPD